MTSGSISVRGASASAPDDAGRPPTIPATQVALRGELITTMIQRSPSLKNLLEILDRHLRESAGLTGVTVYSRIEDRRITIGAGIGTRCSRITPGTWGPAQGGRRPDVRGEARR